MVNDLVGLLSKCGIPWVFHTVDNCVIQDARNQAAIRMLETDCDGLLFIDADQSFPTYALNRLIETDKPVVGFPIVRKVIPYKPNISLYNAKEDEYCIYDDYPRGRLFEVGYIGMGFTYIKREVIEKMTYPYFDFVWHTNKKYKKGQKMMGEDVYFCRKAKEAGFGVWADSTIEIGHIGNFVFTPTLHFNHMRIANAKVEE